MKTVSVTEARANLSKLLTRAEHGETIGITRRGRVVAWLIPPQPLPDFAAVRAGTKRVKGKPLSQVVIDERRKPRS